MPMTCMLLSILTHLNSLLQAATVVAAILCFFAGLECFLNFCAGCWFFQKAIAMHIIPDTVYMVHINALPETK